MCWFNEIYMLNLKVKRHIVINAYKWVRNYMLSKFLIEMPTWNASKIFSKMIPKKPMNARIRTKKNYYYMPTSYHWFWRIVYTAWHRKKSTTHKIVTISIKRQMCTWIALLRFAFCFLIIFILFPRKKTANHFCFKQNPWNLQRIKRKYCVKCSANTSAKIRAEKSVFYRIFFRQRTFRKMRILFLYIVELLRNNAKEEIKKQRKRLRTWFFRSRSIMSSLQLYAMPVLLALFISTSMLLWHQM